jgi:diguanylate cyclase (GGDEF)-like protein/PAS domain S-box-containing protein
MDRGKGGSPKAMRGSPEWPHSLLGIRKGHRDDRRDADDEALLRALIDQVPDLLFVKDPQSRFVLANNATALDVGQTSPEALIGRTDLDFYEESVARRYLSEEQDIMFGALSYVDVEERSWDKSAGEKWHSATKLPLRNEAGEVIGLVGCCRDITDRKREERLHKGEVAILERMAGAADLAEVLDTLLRLVEAESTGIKATILLFDEESGHLHSGAAPSLPQAWIDAVEGCAIGEGVGSCSTAAHRRTAVIVSDVETDPLWKDGRDLIRPFGLRACWSWPIIAADGTILGTSAMYSTTARGPSAVETRLAAFTTHVAGIAIQRRQAEDRIRFLAQNDALTGLPNRARLEPIIDHALRNAAQTRSEVAIVFIDIDNFKNVNDGLGHRAGDGVLQVIAARLLANLGPRETAARFSGDEFVVLMREVEFESGVTLARVAALQAAVGAPIAIDGRTFHLTTSMGVAHYPRDGMTAEVLIANADAALFRAKELGRDNVQLFTSEMKLGLEGRLFRQEEMRRGLREEEFLLHYQPQVSLVTGQVVGVEALVRWLHPTLGLLSPAEFIPLAEQTGLIVKLGDWVLRRACHQAQAWQRAGLPPMTVSVNVSARQFRERHWLAQVAAALAESGLDPGWLELELTESLIMQDPRKAVVTMQGLRDIGVQIAIDDFGTGYSNLRSLSTFPISRLKIDQSFVRGIPDSLGDCAIIGAVISLGHQLGLSVIAEGVETTGQMDFLREKGCDAVQGYLIGHPVAAAVVEERLERAAVDPVQ